VKYPPSIVAAFHAMKHRKHRGFALVVTLTLLVILTVIAVAMLGLSTISLRSNSQGEAMATARANARMSMMLALGELQKELGPDQRISAPGAQLLQENDATGPKHWTGVYDSWKGASWPFATSEEIRPTTPTFRRWLISGDETDPNSIVKNKDAFKPNGDWWDVPEKDKVKLVAATKAQGTTPAQLAVEAGLVKLPKGGSAWWIGDQNTKAKLGGVVEDVADADEPIKAASARLQSAPRAGHEVFQGMEGVLPSDERLGKLPSTDSLEFLSKDIQPFHDATTTSLGLLTNVRAGGLRKDLNFLLEKQSPSITTALYSADRKQNLYPTGGREKRTEPPYEGINFRELWVDHNIWGELLTSGLPSHADGGSIPSSAPYLQCGLKTDPFLSYKHLPRLQLTLLYSLISKSTTDTAGKKVYDLYVVTDPIFTIWNPYDVCLHIPNDSKIWPTLKTWAIPYDLNLNLQGGPTGSKTSYTLSIKDASKALFFFQGQLGKAQNLVLRPGEVQVLAQGFGEPIKYDPSGVDFDPKLGWEFATGYAYSIPYETNNAYKTGAQRITYSMNANTVVSELFPGDPDGAGLFVWAYNIGKITAGTSEFIGSFNTNLVFSRRQDEDSVNAAQRVNVYPPLPLDSTASKTIADLENSKWPICVFTYGLRTEFDPYAASGTRYTGRSMLRANASSLGYDLFDLRGDSNDILRTSPLQIGMRRVNSQNEPIVECDAKGLGYFGASYGSDMGVSYVITRSIPREPIHSLGALQHGAAEGRKNNTSGERQWNLQPSVSHAIANSFAPSFLAPSAVRGTLAFRPAADHSYLANLALWDTYFYSSIKPKTKSAKQSSTTAYSEQKKRLEDFLATGTAYKPLPNERMRPWTSDPKAAIDNIFNGSNPANDAADRIASYLMTDGMFNVNSTSVTAWKAFLSGLKKAKVPSNPSPNLGQPKTIEAEGTAVAALLEAAGEEIDDTTLGDPRDAEQWRGFRSLSDDQIDELAKAIVKQVRLRGPFLSISDFVNRRPGSDKDLALSGALQSALDDEDVTINEAFRQGDRALSLSNVPSGFPFPEAEAGPRAIGAPGYVKQGDLLTTLGPMINVRGDTFVIRGYGEAREGNGASSKVTARAWCEVTVQRVPDYVDPKDESYVPTKDLTSEANKTFGRRFNIVSFRYLDPREVL
jgi:hypothetical protein